MPRNRLTTRSAASRVGDQIPECDDQLGAIPMVFEKLNTPYFACVKEGEDIRWPLFLTIRELSCDERASFRSHSVTLIENYRDCQLFLAALMN
jgi:hypothetical protein